MASRVDDSVGIGKCPSRFAADVARLGDAQAIAERTLSELGELLCASRLAIRLSMTSPARSYCWQCRADEIADDLDNSADVECIPLIAGGLTIGTLYAWFEEGRSVETAEPMPFLPALLALVAASLQTALLSEEIEAQSLSLHQREAELRSLSSTVLRAHEDERRRIALDLHDDAIQRVVLLSREILDAGLEGQAKRWGSALDEIATSLRAVCSGLRPPTLEDFGLPAGLEWLANDLRARSSLAIQCAADCEDGSDFGRLSPELEVALFRVAQEAANNSLKHAMARTMVILLWRNATSVRLSVEDDGSGGPDRSGNGSSGNLGLLGMRERLRPWGGRVSRVLKGPEGSALIAELEVPSDDGPDK
jgi:signal transduction histidine kinase